MSSPTSSSATVSSSPAAPLPPTSALSTTDDGLHVTGLTGEYFTLTHARCEPKPVQRPHPPIVIGGKGPKRTLLATAKWAQQWNAIAQSVDEWSALKTILHEHCVAVGREPAEIDCSVNVMLPPDGELGPSLEKVVAFRDAGADIAIMNLPHGAPISLVDDLATALSTL